MKKTLLTLSLAGLFLASNATAQAPLQAKVLATQPHLVQKVVTEEKCVTVDIDDEARISSRRTEQFMAVGAIAGGLIMAGATGGSPTGVKILAAGAGAYAGAMGGKALAERTPEGITWNGSAAKPESQVTAVPLSASKARPCTTVESVQEVQEGYLSLVAVRGREMVVATEKPLAQGSVIRVYINARGDMEMLP